MDERTLDLNFRILAQPKAGSTWLVHLLSSFIDPDYIFSDLEKYIPFYSRPDTRVPHRAHSPAPDPKLKNIKLLRNPLDAQVSWNNYAKLRNFSKINMRGIHDFYKVDSISYVITYEQLNLDTHEILTKLLKWLNWDISSEEISKVIDKCNMKNLSKYEDSILERDGKFLFYDSKAQNRDKIRFYNKGKCYTFKDYLSTQEIRIIYNKYKSKIQYYWPEIEEMLNV